MQQLNIQKHTTVARVGKSRMNFGWELEVQVADLICGDGWTLMQSGFCIDLLFFEVACLELDLCGRYVNARVLTRGVVAKTSAQKNIKYSRN